MEIHSELRSLWRFLAVGSMAALVHLGIAITFISEFRYAPLLANLIAFLVAVNISFWGHYHWTFQSRTGKKQAGIRFFYTNLGAFLINNLVLIFLLNLGVISDIIAVVVANLIIPIVSFTLGRLWAFK
jgi:putative flippase GtrA